MPKAGITKKNRYGTFAKDCPTLRGIINKICAENRIMSDEVEEILEHYHKWVVEAVSSDTAPNMIIPNFGRLNISATKLRGRIRMAIEYYRKGIYDYEKVCKVVKRFYPLYKRAHKEDLLRGKGITKKDGVTKHSFNRMVGGKVRKNWNAV